MPDPYDPSVDAAKRGLLPTSCLVSLQLAQFRTGPFIDLAEPDAPAPVGDPAPCHLFMPEVAWHAPLPPVLRAPLRELYLQTVEPWSPGWPAESELDDEMWSSLLRVFVGGLFLVCMFAWGFL